jgi:hypothetical protein
MDYKTITFTLPRPLKVDEEEVVIAFFQNIRDNAHKAILNAKKALNPTLLGKERHETYSQKFQYIADNFGEYMKLHNPTPGVYVCKVAASQFAALDFNIGYGIKINFWNKLKDKLSVGFRKEVMRRIGLRPEQVSIEYGEESAD